ncbi:hypothetical protein U3A58_16680 [Algoriphagus sp. C2-6-M1]|uniref:hypothetical protein n=1 Tax=Algoriphagus persicinus TaxID=3108754 RepID=UPI002B36B919|nr:hypothetical protein [Algoriphagus sp. C2-6-M1]MEB2782030.1 hypothetical protein [Algoriphagus sp. C2-6-M1]
MHYHLAEVKKMESDEVKLNLWKFSSWIKSADPVGQGFPSEEISPKPNEPEILSDPNSPKEEEYLPGEEENPLEDPKREIDDPYQPDREQDFPPKREEEIPQEEPRKFRAENIPTF